MTGASRSSAACDIELCTSVSLGDVADSCRMRSRATRAERDQARCIGVQRSARAAARQPLARSASASARRRAPRPSRAAPARCPTARISTRPLSPSSRSHARVCARPAPRCSASRCRGCSAHVDQRLREQRHAGAAARPALGRCARTACSTCSALTMPSPVVCLSRHSRWPGALAAEQPAALAAALPARSGRRPWRARSRCPRLAAPARPPCWSSACRRRRARARRCARRSIDHHVEQLVAVVEAAVARRPSAGGRRRRRARCRSRRRALAPRRPAPAGAVAPTPSLMFMPSGVQPIATTSAPSSWNTCGATW